ncbi:MAG: hypothetical protein E6713_07745 [Sporomusaceae bacterium]|nr:hypothetical protein [Sporomusaceae bacterium]
MKVVKKFMISLLYEGGQPSRTGLFSIIAFLAFLAGSAYLMLKNQSWPHYDTFAALTGGGGLGGLVGNKLINNKYGSPEGQPYIKNNQNGGM